MPSIAATSFVLETEFRHKSSRTSFQLSADVSTGSFSQHVPGVTNISKRLCAFLPLPLIKMTRRLPANGECPIQHA